jgi:hypothetical protein
MSVVSGIWLLARLVESGAVSVDEHGWVTDRARWNASHPGAGPGLVAVDPMHDLPDWVQTESLIQRYRVPPGTAWFQSFDTLESLQRRLVAMEHTAT